MKHSNKPILLLLTSSFPSSPSDETCGYIRDHARSLSVDYDVRVLAPPDCTAQRWPSDSFTLTRSRSLLPRRLDPLKAGADLNNLASRGLLARLAVLLSLVCFFTHALKLALQADAICSHWMVPSGLVGALISRLLGRPHIVVEHSGAVHLLARMRGGKQIVRFIIEGSDRVVTVSTDLKRKLLALCPEAKNKIEVIPMGITLPSPPEKSILRNELTRTILFIGRLTEIKGLDVLLRAIEGLEDLSLIVAGDGDRRRELQALAQALSVNAQFVGRVDAARRNQLLEKCNVVVIPSRSLPNGRTEGTPVVCLEAMAAGRAVIASRVGGLAEAIVDGQNGLLFEPGDHRLLRDKLLVVLGNAELQHKLAENARRSAAAYDWKRIGSRYGRMIDSVLRKNDAIGNRGIEASISG